MSRRRSHRRLKPLEHQIQSTVVTMLRLKARRGVMVIGIHNELPAVEGKLIHFKAMGFKPGAADLLVIVDSAAHFLEMKTDSGRQSQDQKHFEMECELHGIPYAIARSFNEAESILSAWGCFREKSTLRRAA